MPDYEFTPIVDPQGRVAGKKSRKECHSNPDLVHPVVHCWIFNKQGQVLMQQRSFTKETHPGVWDMSCGGHVIDGEDYGENYINVLKRELLEELGVDGVYPVFVKKYIHHQSDQTEMVYLYYADLDISESDFVLNHETEQVKWFNIPEAQESYLHKKLNSTEYIIYQVATILVFRSFNNS
jgi:isopentenyl-diphosphate delta-isomerase type 1